MLMMFGCHIWPQPLSWHQPQLECTENVNCKKEQERVLPFGLDSRKLQDEWLFVFVREDKYQKHSFLLFTLVKRTCWVSLISIYLLCFNNFSYMGKNPCPATLVNFSFANFGWQFICSFQLTSNIHNWLGPSQIFSKKKTNKVKSCCFWRVISKFKKWCAFILVSKTLLWSLLLTLRNCFVSGCDCLHATAGESNISRSSSYQQEAETMTIFVSHLHHHYVPVTLNFISIVTMMKRCD